MCVVLVEVLYFGITNLLIPLALFMIVGASKALRCHGAFLAPPRHSMLAFTAPRLEKLLCPKHLFVACPQAKTEEVHGSW